MIKGHCRITANKEKKGRKTIKKTKGVVMKKKSQVKRRKK